MKRFLSVPTLAFAFLCMLALPGCGQEDPAVKIYSSDEEGIAQCQADHPEKADECKTALTQSQEEHETTVQHYTLEECMEQYGQSACLPRDSGSYYVPAMVGFMFGYAVGGPVMYHPVYVNMSGQAYYGRTVLGAYRPGSGVAYVSPAPGAVWVTHYNVRTVNIPRSTPTAPPSYGYRNANPPSVISRGTAGNGAAPVAAPSRPSVSASPPAISRGSAGSVSHGSTSSG
jgi:uncharacterized protein YgiB involved in biofilm formation